MSAKEDVPYRFLDVDGSLNNVSVRYLGRDDVDDLLLTTKTFAGTLHDARGATKDYRLCGDASDFAAAVRVGDQIAVSYAGDAWEWINATDARDKKLADFCVAKNSEPGRANAPKLTPSFLWNHIKNAEFREWCLKLLSPSARADAAAHPETLDIPKTVGPTDPCLRIPSVRRAVGPGINVPPRTNGPSPRTPQPQTHVETAPRWVNDWYQHVRKIEDAAVALKPANDECDKLVIQCKKECYRLGLIHKYIDTISNFDPSYFPATSKRHRDTLTKSIDHLVEVAADNLFVDPTALLDPPAHKKRQTLADNLWALINATAEYEDVESRSKVKFNDGTNRVFLRGADQPDQQFVLGRFSEIYNFAIDQLHRTHRAADTREQILAALGRLGNASSTGAPSDAHTALEVALSYFGVKPYVFGNFPGPPTLTLGCIQVAMAWKLPGVTGDPAAAATFAQKVRGWIVKQGWVTEAEATQFHTDYVTALKNGNRTDKKAALNKLTSNLQTGWKVTVSVAFLNLYGLYVAIATGDPKTPMQWVGYFANVLNCGTGAALSVMQTFSLLKQGAFLSRALSSNVANNFAIFAAVMGIVSGAVGFYEAVWGQDKIDVQGAILSAATVVGGVATLAGYVIGCALLEVGGVVLLAGVTLISAIIGDNDPTPPQQVVTQLLTQMELTTHFSKALSLKADLKTAFDDFKNLVNGDDGRGGLLQLRTDQKGAKDGLKALGFPVAVIDQALMFKPPPGSPFTM